MGGRPGGRRERQRQSRRHAARCQRMTVSGCTRQDGVSQAPEAAGQCTKEPPIKSAPPRSFDLAADDDELLAKDQVLGDQGCPGRDEGQDDVEQETKEGDHGSERLPRRPVPGRERIWRRDGHVTVGKTGSNSAHVRSICDHHRWSYARRYCGAAGSAGVIAGGLPSGGSEQAGGAWIPQ
jgi:hypothetical protein